MLKNMSDIINLYFYNDNFYYSYFLKTFYLLKMFIFRDSETILKKQNSTLNYTEIENQLSQSDTSNADEFTDTGKCI